MKKKWTRTILTIALSAFTLCMGAPIQTFASFPTVSYSLSKTTLGEEDEGVNITALETDTTYTKYDFTGDGKKDSFKYEIEESDEGGKVAYVYLSDEQIGKAFLIRGGAAYRCQVDDDTNLLVFTCAQFGANIAEAYTCEGGKFEKLDVEFEDYSFDYIQPYAAEDGTLLMVTTSGKHDKAISREQQAYFLVEYEYKNGELSLASHYAKAIKETEYEAATSFSTSSKPEAQNKKGVYVEKGNKIELLQSYLKKNIQYLQIKVNGEKGWIKAGDDLLLESPSDDSNTRDESNSEAFYYIPDSDSKYVTDEDIANLSSLEIILAKNEIYARHGRKFNNSDIQSYFDKQSWYHGTISPDKFEESVLNKYEKENVKFLNAAE